MFAVTCKSNQQRCGRYCKNIGIEKFILFVSVRLLNFRLPVSSKYYNTLAYHHHHYYKFCCCCYYYYYYRCCCRCCISRSSLMICCFVFPLFFFCRSVKRKASVVMDSIAKLGKMTLVLERCIRCARSISELDHIVSKT